MRALSFDNFFENKKVSVDILKSFEESPAELITYDESDINEVIGWASERKRNAIVRSEYFFPDQLETIRNLMTQLDEEFKIKK